MSNYADTHVGLVGDLHGNERWATSVLDALADRGIKTVYQLGDFGLWPGHEGSYYLKWIIDTCKDYDLTFWITPGNHEWYDIVEDPETTDGSVPPIQILSSGKEWEVAVLPRGYAWEFGGRSFVAFGGAPSIDFQHRVRGRSWWPEEMIRESDLLRLKPAEIMLAHDAPDGGTVAVQQIIDTPWWQSGWSEAGLRYAREGRMLMNQAVEIVRPSLFAHGHFHVADERFDETTQCRYLSLGSDGDKSNLGILDLESLTFESATSW